MAASPPGRLAGAAVAAALCLAPGLAQGQSSPVVPHFRSSPVPSLGSTGGSARQAAPAPTKAMPAPRQAAPAVRGGSPLRRSRREVRESEVVNPEALDVFFHNRHRFRGFKLRPVTVNGERKFLVILVER